MDNRYEGYILQDFLDLIEVGTPREQKVMRFRYGIPDDRPLTRAERNLPLDQVRANLECRAHSLEETAREFGVSIERIRLLERKFFRRCSSASRIRRLKDYLE